MGGLRFFKGGEKKGIAQLRDYEGINIEAKVGQLERIKNFNETLVANAINISQRFMEDASAVCYYNAENLAAYIQVVATAAGSSNNEYSAFLRKQAETLDEIGKEQRRFTQSISENVIVPLREWRAADYEQTRAEINKLFALRARLTLHPYTSASIQHGVFRERVQREHDCQLLVVMNMLTNVDRIQHVHLTILADFMTIIIDYARAVEHILAPTPENEATIGFQ